MGPRLDGDENRLEPELAISRAVIIHRVDHVQDTLADLNDTANDPINRPVLNYLGRPAWPTAGEAGNKGQAVFLAEASFLKSFEHLSVFDADAEL